MTSGGVRLLEGTSQIQHVPVDVGCPLVAATLADPYLAVLAEDGTLMLFTLVTSRTLPPKLTTAKPFNPDVSICFIWFYSVFAYRYFCLMHGYLLYVCTCVRLSEWVSECVWVCICMYVYICIGVCICICMLSVRVCLYACMWVCEGVCALSSVV